MRGLLPKLMNIQMELRKCCNHPYLVEGVEDAEMEKLQEVGSVSLVLAPFPHTSFLCISSG